MLNAVIQMYQTSMIVLRVASIPRPKYMHLMAYISPGEVDNAIHLMWIDVCITCWGLSTLDLCQVCRVWIINVHAKFQAIF